MRITYDPRENHWCINREIECVWCHTRYVIEAITDLAIPPNPILEYVHTKCPVCKKDHTEYKNPNYVYSGNPYD